MIKLNHDYAEKEGQLMTVGNEDFVRILLRSDMNAYGMARSFHEEYGIKSLVLGRAALSATANSKIISLRIVYGLNKQETFLSTMQTIADEFKGKKLLLLACGDDYARLIIQNKETL